MILSKPQAEAVYSAMCALNNVGGRIRADFERPLITVLEYPSGGVHVLRDVGGPGNSETYEDQAEFATAYGLGHGGDKNAAALEQIARLGREGTRDGQIIRDAMTEIAEKATAYGLNSDEPQSAVAAAAGCLTQTAIER